METTGSTPRPGVRKHNRSLVLGQRGDGSVARGVRQATSAPPQSIRLWLPRLQPAARRLAVACSGNNDPSRLDSGSWTAARELIVPWPGFDACPDVQAGASAPAIVCHSPQARACVLDELIGFSKVSLMRFLCVFLYIGHRLAGCHCAHRGHPQAGTTRTPGDHGAAAGTRGGAMSG